LKTTKFLNLSAIMIILIAVAAGCGKNGNVLGPNELNNQVSFQISQQGGQNGGTEFLFKPSANVKISRIVSMLPSQQFADTTNFANINYVYSKDTTYVVGEYTGVQNGQQWKFEFSGSVPGQNTSNYKATTNYTVQ